MFTKNFISVKSLQDRMASAVSLFTKVLDSLRKELNQIEEQVKIRDEEIAKLTEETAVLRSLHKQNSSVMDNITRMLS